MVDIDCAANQADCAVSRAGGARGAAGGGGVVQVLNNSVAIQLAVTQVRPEGQGQVRGVCVCVIGEGRGVCVHVCECVYV